MPFHATGFTFERANSTPSSDTAVVGILLGFAGQGRVHSTLTRQVTTGRLSNGTGCILIDLIAAVTAITVRKGGAQRHIKVAAGLQRRGNRGGHTVFTVTERRSNKTIIHFRLFTGTKVLTARLSGGIHQEKDKRQQEREVASWWPSWPSH